METINGIPVEKIEEICRNNGLNDKETEMTLKVLKDPKSRKKIGIESRSKIDDTLLMIAINFPGKFPGL